MKIINAPIVGGIDESGCRRLFTETYVINNKKEVILKFQGIPITFSETDFEHAVFEPNKNGNKKGQFSKRQASRILWIKEIINEVFSYRLLFEPETGNYCLFCEDLEYVVFLWPNKFAKTLRFRSAWAFGKQVEQVMKKYKNGDKFVEVKEVLFENKGC